MRDTARTSLFPGESIPDDTLWVVFARPRCGALATRTTTYSTICERGSPDETSDAMHRFGLDGGACPELGTALPGRKRRHDRAPQRYRADRQTDRIVDTNFAPMTGVRNPAMMAMVRPEVASGEDPKTGGQ